MDACSLNRAALISPLVTCWPRLVRPEMLVHCKNRLWRLWSRELRLLVSHWTLALLLPSYAPKLT